MKDMINLPGRIQERVKHFDKIKEILGCRPITRPTNCRFFLAKCCHFLCKNAKPMPSFQIKYFAKKSHHPELDSHYPCPPFFLNLNLHTRLFCNQPGSTPDSCSHSITNLG